MAEFSPGRSPGWRVENEKSRRDDWKLPGDDPRDISISILESEPCINIFQSSLRDFSMGLPTQDCVLG
jgi:hypothetical protein